MDKYNIYAINICVDTKTTDIYDKVAINKFPIIISCASSKLTEMLNNIDIQNYIKTNISKHLYNTAQFYVRIIDENGIYNDTQHHSYVYNIKDIVNIEYD